MEPFEIECVNIEPLLLSRLRQVQPTGLDYMESAKRVFEIWAPSLNRYIQVCQDTHIYFHILIHI